MAQARRGEEAQGACAWLGRRAAASSGSARGVAYRRMCFDGSVEERCARARSRFTGAARGVDERARARRLAVLELAAKHVAARQDEQPAAVPRVVLPVALVRRAVGILGRAVAVPRAAGKLALVDLTVT
eukprot:89389-Prymnesium_polylepis.1